METLTSILVLIISARCFACFLFPPFPALVELNLYKMGSLNAHKRLAKCLAAPVVLYVVVRPLTGPLSWQKPGD
jgi:predicted exporter